MIAAEQQHEHRWIERPVLSGVVGAVSFLLPIVLSVAAAVAVSRVMDRPHGFGATLLWWGGLTAITLLTLAVVDRLARRLLPLAALLRMSMLFPDRAPSRFRVAFRAGTVRHLERRVQYARSHGLEDEPAKAAETILTLAAALSAHDRKTRGHSERVRAFTDLLAAEMKLPPGDRDRLRWAALLHDIGKLGVSPAILNKQGEPDEDEWAVIHRHPEDGARIVAPLRPWLGPWAESIEHHHEKWDGTGYPFGLSGEHISLGARIVAVADSYEVMTAVRSYKKSLSAADARRELAACAGTHFDPAVVRAFLNIALGRLRWAMGPIAWLVEVPLLGGVPRAVVAPLVQGNGATAAVVAGAVAATSLGFGGWPSGQGPTTASAGAGPQVVVEQVEVVLADRPMRRLVVNRRHDFQQVGGVAYEAPRPASATPTPRVTSTTAPPPAPPPPPPPPPAAPPASENAATTSAPPNTTPPTTTPPPAAADATDDGDDGDETRAFGDDGDCDASGTGEQRGSETASGRGHHNCLFRGERDGRP